MSLPAEGGPVVYKRDLVKSFFKGFRDLSLRPRFYRFRRFVLDACLDTRLFPMVQKLMKKSKYEKYQCLADSYEEIYRGCFADYDMFIKIFSAELLNSEGKLFRKDEASRSKCEQMAKVILPFILYCDLRRTGGVEIIRNKALDAIRVDPTRVLTIKEVKQIMKDEAVLRLNPLFYYQHIESKTCQVLRARAYIREQGKSFDVDYTDTSELYPQEQEYLVQNGKGQEFPQVAFEPVLPSRERDFQGNSVDYF